MRISDWSSDVCSSDLAAIVADHAPGTGATLAFDPGGYPAMDPTEGNKALLAKLNGVNRDLGLAEMAALDPLKRGAGDISFVAADVDSLAGPGTYRRSEARREREEAVSTCRYRGSRCHETIKQDEVTIIENTIRISTA